MDPPVLLIQEVIRGNVTASDEYERTIAVPQTVSSNPLNQQKRIVRRFQGLEYQLELGTFILVLRYEMWKNLFFDFSRVSFNWLSELIEANYYFSKGLPKSQIHIIFQNTTESTGISSLMVRSILLRKLKRIDFFYMLPFCLWNWYLWTNFLFYNFLKCTENPKLLLTSVIEKER